MAGDYNQGRFRNHHRKSTKIYGSQKFVKRIKDRYIVSEPDPAIPQQKSIIKDTDPVQLLKKASKVLQCDLERIKNSPRVSESDKFRG